MKKIIILSIIIALFTSFFIYSVSLWDDRAKNILTKKINYEIGESIQILIDEETSYKYKSNTKSLKTYKINMSGGELSGIFQFIPEGDVEENKNSNDTDALSIKTTIQSSIQSINGNLIRIRGTKRITLNNKTSTIAVTGDVYYTDIDNNTVLYSKLINPVLNITSIIENSNRVLNNNDLETVILNPDATTDIQEETRLTDAKKRQLTIDYFNKILNLIF